MKSDLVLIKNYNNEIEARMMAQILEENGVNVMIHKDDSGSMRPYLQNIFGVQILVNEENVKKAEKIIEKFEKDLLS